VIVQSAVIVQPMNTRGVPVYQSSLTDGAATRVRPVQEAVIAIDPDEVALLTEALAVEAKLTSIPRSGRPDDPPASRTPNLHPVSPFSSGESFGDEQSEVGPDPATAQFQRRQNDHGAEAVADRRAEALTCWCSSPSSSSRCPRCCRSSSTSGTRA
jgi:hypothetical protein